jgi:hypothetical protein
MAEPAHLSTRWEEFGRAKLTEQYLRGRTTKFTSRFTPDTTLKQQVWVDFQTCQTIWLSCSQHSTPFEDSGRAARTTQSRFMSASEGVQGFLGLAGVI